MKDALGIYLSIPFCRSKCSYCNFASGVFPEALQQRYVEVLSAEIEQARARAKEWDAVLPDEVDSVYLGGGTPGILSAPLLRRLWTVLRGNFTIEREAEITLECAPGQLKDDALAAMLEGGVNRISFGVQSFVDREAAAAGRVHTRKAAFEDLRRVRAAGIERVSVDLIAGLARQTPESWRESLETLTDAGVGHASIYMLEIDEDSRLGRELLAGGSRYHASSAPAEDATAEMYSQAILHLEADGLMQYEISNFAAPGEESIHNMKYWLRRPYLGFGLDSHSLLPGKSGGALRFKTSDSMDGYLAGDPVDKREISVKERLEEAWFLGLRMRMGVELKALAEEFGDRHLSPFLPVVDHLGRLGLLTVEDGRIGLTSRGVLLSNEVFAGFLDVVPEGELPRVHSAAD